MIYGSDLSDFLNGFTVIYLFLNICFMYFEPYSEIVLSSHFYLVDSQALQELSNAT